MSEGNSRSRGLSARQVAARVAILVLGLCLIAASLVHAAVRQDSYEESMRPYDAAVDLVEQVNGNMYLRGVDADGKEYDYVVLDKASLEWFAAHPGTFEGNITSSYRYRIIFDDLNISDEDSYPSLNLSSSYVFGEAPPRGASTVTMTVQYAMHLRNRGSLGTFAEHWRHVCSMTVEVWE